MALTQENSLSTEALTRKLNEILSDNENDVGQFCFKEETIEEFMQELYNEIIACPPQPAPSPTPTPTPLPSSSNGSLVVQLDPHDESMVLNEETKDEGDFDDEWLARVLNWGQGQAMDTSDWF